MPDLKDYYELNPSNLTGTQPYGIAVSALKGTDLSKDQVYKLASFVIELVSLLRDLCSESVNYNDWD